jgi:hypothetical protein
LVDQPHIEEVEQMHLVFDTEGCELHPNQCRERQEPERSRRLDFRDIGCGERILGPDFFSGKNDVNGIAWLRSRSIEKRRSIWRQGCDESHSLESWSDSAQIGPPEK